MRILISNDDGVHAPGLRELAKELKKLGKIWVVAPLEERSTTGHSLTIHKPLRMLSLGGDFYGVSGSPADCVYLGIREVIGEMPDLVISGINRGANLGQDVYYSGTVSAAREACILGIPSMAVSLAVDFRKARPESELHYSSAAKIAVRVLKSLKAKVSSKKSPDPSPDESMVPKHTLLNLNVPDLPLGKIKGVRCVKLGFRFYSGSVLRRRDHRGKDYYWVGGQYNGFKREKNTDCFAVDNRFAALTPLKLDSTDHPVMESLAQRFTKK